MIQLFNSSKHLVTKYCALEIEIYLGVDAKMFPPGIGPVTFGVLGGCVNHYTTKTLARGMS
jgi:hypothetical protein